MRIAYVEDNMINLALVQRIATMSGHEITSYTEGETALAALSQQPFDLIMMDVELAGELNGLQVVRALRARGMTTPIVAVTAYAMMGDREKCLEAGCNDYLPKPLPIAEFLTLLARYDTLIQKKQTTAPSTDVPKPKLKQTGPLVDPAPLLVAAQVNTPPSSPVANAVTDQQPAPPAASTVTASDAKDSDSAAPLPSNGGEAKVESKVERVVAAPLPTPAASEAPTASGP